MATRSAIGTERPEPADFGSPNSPRTKGETTRSFASLEVDVAPTQAEQLPLAQPGHGGGQVERWLYPAEDIVRIPCRSSTLNRLPLAKTALRGEQMHRGDDATATNSGKSRRMALGSVRRREQGPGWHLRID